ncbi:MAG: RagB/SusD family nutrient uptake outer membrane protein [Mangrovibacterium sp.]
MKNIICFCLVVLLCGCSDFLDRDPLDQISAADYWATSSDLELYLNQYYPSLQGMFTTKAWGGYLGGDDNSDHLILEQPDDRLRGIRTVPGSGGGWTWTSVRSVNYFLTHYRSVDDSWENIRQYVGEAFFFKAYFYFGLLQHFGDVPWLTEPLGTDSENLYMVRTPRSTVTDSIVACLDKAMAYMRSKGDDNPPPSYRLNSEIALLFKSRVCLFEGTWEKHHAGTAFGVPGSDGNKFLALAADAAKQLINKGLYEVYNEGKPNQDYTSLFAQADYSSSPEVMFWRSFDFDLGLYHTIPSTRGLGHGLTKWLVDSYLCSDGLPVSVSPLYQGDDNGTDVATNRDPRLVQTIWKPGDIKSITGIDTIWYTKPDINLSGEQNINTTGYQLKKGFYLDPVNVGETVISETGDIIFRYAEALLNYAEAKAEMGSVSQADIDLTINKLRDRAGMPHLIISQIITDPDWNWPELSPLINEIRRERGVEFASEGFRLNDLLRWRSHQLFTGKRPKGAKFIQTDFPEMLPGVNIFIDNQGYIDIYQKSLPSGYGFDPDRDYLDPIPNSELLLNQNISQNPGWD